MSRIGIYGGSFDPVHIGHLLVARAAMEEMSLSSVIFVPAARSPFKSNLEPAAADFRLSMLNLALENVDNMEVSDWEVTNGGLSFTIRTVEHFREIYPNCEIVYIIGADQCSGLHKWKSAQELSKLVQFAVIPRPGVDDTKVTHGFMGTLLKGVPIDLSSSSIRKRISQNLSIRWLVPEKVEDFIHRNNLYL